ncbi:MAG: hypothetical protein M0Z94_00295 [Dehalococcoidales bacterium]|nr:hypothetical protein [Dehalococcoidales bacterium]
MALGEQLIEPLADFESWLAAAVVALKEGTPEAVEAACRRACESLEAAAADPATVSTDRLRGLHARVGQMLATLGALGDLNRESLAQIANLVQGNGYAESPGPRAPREGPGLQAWEA